VAYLGQKQTAPAVILIRAHNEDLFPMKATMKKAIKTAMTESMGKNGEKNYE